MALNKYKIGELICQRREKYDGIEDLPVRGVTRDGFIPPKQAVADKSIYNVFYRGDFVFNPARMELNSIAYNNVYDKGICSSLYEIFYVSRTDILLPEYLNMFIKRDEFARRCWFNAIGSARNYFRVSDLSEFEIELPPVGIQRKYVSLYNGLFANMCSYEKGLSDLKLVCDGFIEDLRKKCKTERIGKYIKRTNEKNTNGKIQDVMGLSTQKEWREPNSRVNTKELKSYRIVHQNDFAFVPTTDTWKVLAFSYNDFDKDIVVSPIYETFSIDTNHILPGFLSIFLERKEFDRYARYNSWGSARENFTFDDMCNVTIPIPSIEVQKAIVSIRNILKKRKHYSTDLRQIVINACPVLLSGSIMEAKGGN